MGMYDYIHCKYPLPVPGATDHEYQTKDTPAQWLENYEIREDGTLWQEEYDTEDQSAIGLWRKDHPGEEIPKDDPELHGVLAMAGCLTRVNKRWVQLPNYQGVIVFYTVLPDKQWLEWSATFKDGKLVEVHQHDRDV